MNYNTMGKNGEIVEVSVYDIVIDLERHPRKEIYKETIQEYAKALSKGFMLPEIEVFFDGETYHLAEGYYRVEAHRLAGLDLIPANVKLGGRKEALIHALGANADHGLRRTNDDKKKAVKIALKDPDIQKWSDRKIAFTCRVSQPFVSARRKELTDSGYQFSTTRVCANGQTMETANIGHKGEDVSAPVDPEVIAPVDPEVIAPVDPEVIAPADPEVIAPVDPEVIAPADPEVIAPADPEVIDPADPEVIDPVDLDDFDPDALKLLVIQLQELTKIQEEKIEDQINYITDLEKTVEKLKDYNEYLRKELQGSIKEGVEATAFLDINSMEKTDVLFEA